jgi:hypothetical protein
MAKAAGLPQQSEEKKGHLSGSEEIPKSQCNCVISSAKHALLERLADENFNY